MITKEQALEAAEFIVDVERGHNFHDRLREAIADALLDLQFQTAEECARTLETEGVLLSIPRNLKKEKIMRFALMCVEKIRVKFPPLPDGAAKERD